MSQVCRILTSQSVCSQLCFQTNQRVLDCFVYWSVDAEPWCWTKPITRVPGPHHDSLTDRVTNTGHNFLLSLTECVMCVMCVMSVMWVMCVIHVSCAYKGSHYHRSMSSDRRHVIHWGTWPVNEQWPNNVKIQDIAEISFIFVTSLTVPFSERLFSSTLWVLVSEDYMFYNLDDCSYKPPDYSP